MRPLEESLAKMYTATRDALAEQLLRDADAHEAERYDEIGRRFDSVEHAFPAGGDPALVKLRVALVFWDAWIDARNRMWQASGGIKPAEWPNLARRIAADLMADREISDPRVLQQFDVSAHSRLGDRVEILAARLRDRSGR